MKIPNVNLEAVRMAMIPVAVRKFLTDTGYAIISEIFAVGGDHYGIAFIPGELAEEILARNEEEKATEGYPPPFRMIMTSDRITLSGNLQDEERQVIQSSMEEILNAAYRIWVKCNNFDIRPYLKTRGSWFLN